MFFGWLKQYMPRGLYARAGLILLLPVLTLQLLVSVVFIQRHFEGVTRQMSDSVAIELRFLRDTANNAETFEQAKQDIEGISVPLGLASSWGDTVPEIGNDKPYTDFTGNTVIANLQRAMSDIAAISLANRGRVTVWIVTKFQILEVTFPRRRVSASNPHQLLVIMVVLGSLMTLVAYFFLRNQLRPIKRMAAAAQAFGKGNIVNYSPAGAAEVRAAGAAFLDMRNRIERHTQNRTMMLSGVSHDLRTPLTRLKLGLSMIDNADSAPLKADVDEMQKLLDGFLDFARNNADDEMSKINPHSLIDKLFENAKRAQLNVVAGEKTGPEVILPMRQAAMSRALDNLCNNALRYGSKALVSSFVTERSVRFVVEDDGPGIPAEDHEDALRPFVRLDPSRNQDQGSGVGLGLSIVNDIARAHGGLLRLGQSESLGGLKAEIVLPR